MSNVFKRYDLRCDWVSLFWRQTCLCIEICMRHDVIHCMLTCVAECPSGQVFSDCSGSCPYVCEDLWSHTQCLPGPCTSGCTCPPGQVWTPQITCVGELYLTPCLDLILACLTVSLIGAAWRLLCVTCRLSLFTTVPADILPKQECQCWGEHRFSAATWNGHSASLQHMVIHNTFPSVYSLIQPVL